MKNAFVHSFTKLKAKQQIKKKVWMHFTLRSNLRTEQNVLKHLETLFFRKISKGFREKNAAKFAT